MYFDSYLSISTTNERVQFLESELLFEITKISLMVTKNKRQLISETFFPFFQILSLLCVSTIQKLVLTIRLVVTPSLIGGGFTLTGS